jgi:hypothetical protein
LHFAQDSPFIRSSGAHCRWALPTRQYASSDHRSFRYARSESGAKTATTTTEA